MPKTRNYELPNQQTLDDAYNSFCEIAESMMQLNKTWFDQAKIFFEANVAHAKRLYKVSTPEELTSMLAEVTTHNSSILAKAYLEELNIIIQMYNKLNVSSQAGINAARVDGFQLYDFYSKLLPNPVSLKLDEVFKGTANGNHAGFNAMQQFAEKMLSLYGSSVKESAESLMTNLDNIKNSK